MMMRHNTHSGGREEGVMPYPALLRSCAQPSPRHRPHKLTHETPRFIMYTFPLTPPPHGTRGALATAAAGVFDTVLSLWPAAATLLYTSGHSTRGLHAALGIRDHHVHAYLRCYTRTYRWCG